MPLTPIDYNKTQIYKLIHNDDINNENIYIGSTTNFVKRKYNHKYDCNNEKAKIYNLKVYQNIRNNGGWIEWKMLLVEKFPCIDKRESDVRERYWIDHFKSQLNTKIPTRSDKEHYNDNRKEILEKNKNWKDNNKEKINEYYKNYRLNNTEKAKNYRQNNKEEIKNYRQKNYEKNKEKIKKKQREKYQINKQKRAEELSNESI